MNNRDYVMLPGGNQSFVPGMGSLPRFMPTTSRTPSPKCPLCGDKMLKNVDAANKPVFECCLCKISQPAE